MLENNEIVIFKASTTSKEFQIILDENNETVWANEQQIATIFERDRTVIGRHIKNIFKEKELDKISVSAKIAHTASDGKKYQVIHYNLDVIISVGYRVKSKIATEFRKWATSKLKEYLIQGYSINYDLLESQKAKIKLLENQVDSLNEKTFETQKNLTEGFLNIVSTYSRTFELLNQYDTEELSTRNLERDIIYTRCAFRQY